jgi:hypothetical protein
VVIMTTKIQSVREEKGKVALLIRYHQLMGSNGGGHVNQWNSWQHATSTNEPVSPQSDQSVLKICRETDSTII